MQLHVYNLSMLDLCTCTFIHDMYAYLEHLLAYVCIQFITEGMHINYFIWHVALKFECYSCLQASCFLS